MRPSIVLGFALDFVVQWWLIWSRDFHTSQMQMFFKCHDGWIHFVTRWIHGLNCHHWTSLILPHYSYMMLSMHDSRCGAVEFCVFVPPWRMLQIWIYLLAPVLLAPYLFEFQIGYEGRRQWTPISNGPWKIFDSLIAHGWVLSPLSGLCFHIQINLWTLPFLLGCHNVDIILGRLDYIPYSNIGWFFHAIPHYKLKSCIARATSWRTIKIEIEFRMETFTTGHIVIGFLVFTAWNICYIYFLSQRGSSETRANRTVEEQRTVLQTFGSAIFHAFQCHNWFLLHAFQCHNWFLLPWKKGPKSKVANSHSYFPIGFGWCCSKCHLPLPKTSPAILYLWRGENAETG